MTKANQTPGEPADLNALVALAQREHRAGRLAEGAEAYRQITRWAGAGVADRVCSTNATAIVHGLPLRVPAPEPRRRGWFAWFR